MSSIDYFLSSIQGNANKRDYVKKYVITFIFVYDILHKRHISFLRVHNFLSWIYISFQNRYGKQHYMIRDLLTFHCI